ncbi:hypothetical protein PIB30_103902 [Stylosanthes scabra]|uniref:Uncharacterized protein n=1 Tax=Stylosanthes scabra TaxID=79078 RepID=A0ABU6RZ25_9FABA|nr:hypothetical protein [Stylosanthes scabra]
MTTNLSECINVEDRFLFNRIGSEEINMYRCVMRYGYTDLRNEHEPFEVVVVRRLREFVADEVLVPQENNVQSGGEIMVEEEDCDGVIRSDNAIVQAVDSGIVHKQSI